MQAAKRILRFLKGTPSHGIWFHKGPLTLSAYSDADWAGCTFDRRSTGGFCVFLGSNLVSWSAKKQPTVARSSTEAEYRSLAHTAAEVTWICKVFRDFGFSSSVKPTIWCDNISAISLASNPVFHARTKHVEIDYHYIRELVLANLVTVQYVCSQDQIADIHTKSLSKNRFLFLQSKLSLGTPSLSKLSLRGCKDKDAKS
ncbi:transposable element gene [Prunus dulcis]|uniref:Transposable element protein n=1 Tax=Prunus dulcis TaxID=3755 RepID=A0A4Y1RU02_PRUDU|nr:transposable element gene [Prunus dulcis]